MKNNVCFFSSFYLFFIINFYYTIPSLKILEKFHMRQKEIIGVDIMQQSIARLWLHGLINWKKNEKHKKNFEGLKLNKEEEKRKVSL